MPLHDLVKTLGVTRTSLREQMLWLTSVFAPSVKWTATKYDDIGVLVFSRLTADNNAFNALCDSLGLPKESGTGLAPIGWSKPVLDKITMTRSDVKSFLVWADVLLRPFSGASYASVLAAIIHGWIADDKAFGELCDVMGIPLESGS